MGIPIVPVLLDDTPWMKRRIPGAKQNQFLGDFAGLATFAETGACGLCTSGKTCKKACARSSMGLSRCCPRCWFASGRPSAQNPKQRARNFPAICVPWRTRAWRGSECGLSHRVADRHLVWRRRRVDLGALAQQPRGPVERPGRQPALRDLRRLDGVPRRGTRPGQHAPRCRRTVDASRHPPDRRAERGLPTPGPGG